MNEWFEFLASLNLANTSVADQEPTLIPMGHHRLLSLQGKDAATFLQGQTTCDIRRLEQSAILLGGQCNPKGRMISSFCVAKLDAETIGLRVHESIETAALNALKKYIVFSKATLQFADYTALALLYPDASKLTLEACTPGHFFEKEGTTWLYHSAELLEIWVPTSKAIELWSSLSAIAQPAPPDQLTHYWITRGITEVQEKTSEEFVPQVLNYHLIDGISFKKGCYTGQEIVARMQYRGQLKKHTYLMTGPESNLRVGSSLSTPKELDKSVATVVASVNIGGKWWGLVATTEDIYSAESTLCDSDTGAYFSWEALPYAIP